MNTERIIELAEQAGFENGHQDCNGNSLSNELEKFAELIAAEEREACAKVCEAKIKSYMSKRYTTDPLGGYRERFVSEQCAAAIRARGNE